MGKHTCKILFCLTLLLFANLTACDVASSSNETPIISGDNSNISAIITSPDVSDNKCTDNVKESPRGNLQRVPEEIGDFNFLESNGNTKYAWRFEDDDCVLYAMSQNDTNVKQLAIFPPLRSEYANNIELNYIIDFGICDNWIIVSVGHYEGSGHYFYGDFARLKKDGSELEHFWLTAGDEFVIINDWIYYNFWTVQDKPENVYGCYRIHPDGSEKEYLGDTINAIYFYSEDGYIYGNYATNDTVHGMNPLIDFIRCKPDGSEMITLMKGETLPEFDSSDYISYYDIETSANTVSFTASVHGYSPGDSWRGHDVYTAKYQVDKDGSNLILLSEEYDD